MTREEAIEIFKNMLDAWDNYYTIAQSDKKREAVELAISSLETDEAYQLEYERTTKDDLGVDCISRADAIKAMQDKAKKLKNEDTINGLCGAVAILFDMPSVTPQEPKTGHWINKQRLFESCSAECSSCHKRSNGYLHDNGFGLECKYYDFCPKCGAKMVEPQKSEDKG